jgi:hypothetical protein
MPLFNGFANNLATAVYCGDRITMFAAETLTAPATSIVIAIGSAAVAVTEITFQSHFATSPTASLAVYGSNYYPTSSGPTNGLLQGTITTQDASVTVQSIYEFYWCVLNSQSGGGALSLIAMVS